VGLIMDFRDIIKEKKFKIKVEFIDFLPMPSLGFFFSFF